MPRILRIINRLNLGGPTYNVAYLTRYLQPAYETLLVSGMKDETEESSEFIVKKLGIDPVYVPEMQREIALKNDWVAYWKIRQIIRKFKPDIVHTHAAKAGTLGRLAAYHEGVPAIAHTFHGHVFHSYFGPLKTNMFIAIERYLAAKSDAIVAISKQQKHELCNVYRVSAPEKTAVIPLGFDLARFTENQAEKRESFRKKYLLKEDEKAIGIIGRLVPVKNHKLFIDAMKRVADCYPGIRLFIVGDGEDRKKIETFASAAGFDWTDFATNPRVATLTFTSWIKEIEVALAGLDMVALTSLNEGTPVSLIEAQAAGKPIVSTRVGGIEDIIAPALFPCLCAPPSAEVFAEKTMRLISSNEHTGISPESLREFVLQKFHYGRLVKDMYLLYQKLLGTKSA